MCATFPRQGPVMILLLMNQKIAQNSMLAWKQSIGGEEKYRNWSHTRARCGWEGEEVGQLKTDPKTKGHIKYHFLLH